MKKKSQPNNSLKVVLSLNAIAIIVVGLIIANAINPGFGFDLRVVNERSDVAAGSGKTVRLSDNNIASQLTLYEDNYSTGGLLPSGELWPETSLEIYQTADIDLCVELGASVRGELYWQTSNTSVIDSFYDTSREYLGFPNDRCKMPHIVGVGATTITAGTYDGVARDVIDVVVLPIPTEKWKNEVLKLVNHERAKLGLTGLIWGDACAEAADLRAREIEQNYSHDRPDGESWSTACPVPDSGGSSGENIHMGYSAVSPVTTVEGWLNSPEHRANILSDKYTKLSVGFHFDVDSEFRTYWTQYFTTW
ncbi:MAG: CAP domain-containing protein [Candidatus Nomurabacteria bacterium]|jgi:uncharacterized protein YkwD|nr:CAP domain-containing protein [Candidatus Nomurabacteria bacterium]